MNIFFPKQNSYLNFNLALISYPLLFSIEYIDNIHFYIRAGIFYLSKDENNDMVMSKNNTMPKQALLFKIVDNILKTDDLSVKIENGKLILSEFSDDTVIITKSNIYNRITLNIYVTEKISGSYNFSYSDHVKQMLFDFLKDKFKVIFLPNFNFEKTTNHLKEDLYLVTGLYIWHIDSNVDILKNWNFSLDLGDFFVDGNIRNLMSYKYDILDINTDQKYLDEDFLDAIKECQNSQTLIELKRGLRNYEYIDEEGNTSLMIAIKYNLENTALSLIKSTDLNRLNNEGKTALNLAIENKNKKIASKILDGNINLELGDDNLKLSMANKLKGISKILCRRVKLTDEHLELAFDVKDTYVSNYILRKSFLDEERKREDEEEFNFNDATDENLNLACKFDRKQEAEYLINNMEKINDSSCLIYACINNMDDICLKLINKGADINVEMYGRKLEYFVESENIMLKIIQCKTKVLFSNDFQLFNYDDFTIAEEVGDGSFAFAKSAFNKLDNKHYILKESSNCSSEELIPGDIIREIYMLRRINATYPEICAKLYGIVYLKDKNCIYLVLEPCGITINKYFNNLSEDDRKNNFKSIFSQIINNVYKLHSMGIIHKDLHKGNILIKDNSIKFIDLGVSYFHEIYPLVYNIPEWHDRFWIPLDNMTDEQFNDYNFPINVSKKSNYSLDIFAIGVLMVHTIYELKMDKLFGDKYNGITYFDYDKSKYYKMSLHKIDEYSPLLTDLIKKMVHQDANIRYTAREVLSHPYFAEKNPIPIEYFENDIDEPEDDIGKLFYDKYYAPDRIDNEQVRMVHDIYKNDIVKIFNKPKKSDIDYIMDKKSDLTVSFNVIFNTIFALFQYNTYDEITEKMINSYLYIFGSIYDYYNISNFSADINKKFTTEEIKTKDIMFTPVTVHFSYLMIKMRNDNIDSDEYHNNFRYMFSSFVSFLYNVDCDFNIWNVISVIMHRRVEGIDDYDLSNYDKIMEILNK